MKRETENTAQEHQEAANAMIEATRRINEFMEYQKNIKKQVIRKLTLFNTNTVLPEMFMATLFHWFAHSSLSETFAET